MHMTRREREVTDIEEIDRILSAGRVIHLGLTDGDWPYVLPMNYGYTLNDGVLTFYLHGARRGYKYDLIAKNPKVSFSIETGVQPFDGDIACRYGTAYESVLGRGTAHIVEDTTEKQKALRVFMKTQTGKDFLFSEQMVSIVNVLRIDVTEFSAKRRPYPEK